MDPIQTALIAIGAINALLIVLIVGLWLHCKFWRDTYDPEGKADSAYYSRPCPFCDGDGYTFNFNSGKRDQSCCACGETGRAS